jgi:hypothetical protein
MSAAARAEARRKAILSRGTDRLAKLTTSARGEDAPAYLNDDPPLPSLRAFVGEETRANMPTPRSVSGSSSASRTPSPLPEFNAGPPTGPSPWSEEQQQQFLAALMSGNGPLPPLPGQRQPQSQLLPPKININGEPISPADDPLAALMSSFSNFGEPGASAPGKVDVAPPTRLQKLMPFVHLVAMWSLLAYFVFWKEPAAFDEATRGAVGGVVSGRWRRWADLAWKNTNEGGWGVQLVPFFWAFTTLQIALHSVRIFSGFDAIQPPMLLALALPHLPSPFPSIITNGLKYLQMGGLFLDDLAGLIVGVGFLILLAGWFSG